MYLQVSEVVKRICAIESRSSPKLAEEQIKNVNSVASSFTHVYVPHLSHLTFDPLPTPSTTRSPPPLFCTIQLISFLSHVWVYGPAEYRITKSSAFLSKADDCLP